MNEADRQLEIQLVAYLVGGLDDAERAGVEATLRSSADARSRLDDLRLVLTPLAADSASPAPPPDLAVRTYSVIAENWCRELPRAPETTPSSAGSPPAWWRRMDVLVAACILVTLLGLAAPTLYRLREGAARVDCQNNLREFGVALAGYRDLHGNFPNIADYAPQEKDFAGLVIPILIDAGTLSSKANVRCPAVGPPLMCDVTLQSAKDTAVQELHCRAPLFTPSYAYSLGYQDETGVYHPPGLCNDQSASNAAIMADGPPPGTRLVNSPNHGGEGQNILFMDGSVRFYTVRFLGEDDIYRTQAGGVSASQSCLDIILGNSSARATILEE